MSSKRMMKRVRRKSDKHSTVTDSTRPPIAPLLETISALAVNSDQSDSDLDDYEMFADDCEPPVATVANHDPDEDDLEDEYNFDESQPSLPLDQDGCSKNCDQSHFTNIVENDEDQRRSLEENGLKMSSEVRTNLSRRANINALFEQVNQSKSKTRSRSKVSERMIPAAIPSKCVRFNADVQITSVSPRMSAKFTANTTNSGGFKFESNEELRASSPANTYDEVASVTGELEPPHERYPEFPKAIVKTKKKPTTWQTGNLSTSSSGTSISDCEQQQQQQQPNKAQYANVMETVQQYEQQSKSGKVLSHTALVHNQQSNSQKSILKDPLCAKLRSAVKKGQFVLTDTAKLESEIDILLYGNDSFQRNNDQRVSGEMSANEILSSIQEPTSSATCDRSIDNLIQNEIPEIFTDRYHNHHHRRPPTFSNRPLNSELSCNSYVQMIEEKYRLKDSDSVNQLATTTVVGRSHDPPPASTTTKTKSKSSKSSKKQTNETSKKSTTNTSSATFGDNPETFKSKPSFDSYLDIVHPITPLFTTNMDQLMKTLMHESKEPSQEPAGGHQRHQKRMPTSVSNEKLYSLFADPIKGPCINLLMDELSRLSTNQNSDTESNKSGSNLSSYFAKSLAENHIYEEILYECLEQEQNGQSNQPKMSNDVQLNLDTGLKVFQMISNANQTK